MAITNLDLLKEYASGDVNFMLELLSIYKNETPKAIEQIKFHTGQQNWSELKMVIHKLKSSVSMLGINQLAHTISKMEQNIKTENNTLETINLSYDLIEQCQISVSEVDHHIQNLIAS